VLRNDDLQLANSNEEHSEGANRRQGSYWLFTNLNAKILQ